MDREDATARGPVSVRAMELIAAAALMAIGVVTMADSLRVGAGWASDGPQAGYFPFRMGLVLFLASGVVFAVNLIGRRASRRAFVEAAQFKMVLQVLLPSAAYVALIGAVGIYVAAGLFIGFFMWRIGRYPLWKLAPVSVLVPLALFFMFEVWFLVPLRKGPLEAFFGY